MSGESKLPSEVSFTHLDEQLFDGADATKRDLVEYLDAVQDRMLPCLRDRPLSVIRIRPGQPAFMQKNLPKYTPDWVSRVPIWAEASRREVSYALCNDRRTLLWFANQRALEYHVTLFRVDRWDQPDYLVLDLDPPEGAGFAVVVQAAHLIRQALTDAGMAGAVKTSGAKGLHVFVPLAAGSSPYAPSGSTLILRRQPSSRTSARARCSSTRHAPEVRPSCLPTAHGSGQGYPCRFQLHGTTLIRSPRPTSPSTTRPDCWTGLIPGPTRCRQPSRWTPTWWPRDTRFPLLVCKRCMRANGGLVHNVIPDAR